MIQANPYPRKQAETTQFAIHKPVLKVMGLGGGGGNAINRMIELGIEGVQFIAANTDQQVLKMNLAPVKIQLGPERTRGLGAGGTPKVGREAALESRKEIAAALQGADMVFLTAGMGGGTGTGSIPIAAEIARKLGAVTIAVVTTPFSFEMGTRQRNAFEGIRELQKHCDTLITIPNERLLAVADKNVTLPMAFRMADDVLRQAVQGITELITEPGIINVDFAHIRAHMKMGGGALMSMGIGEGPERAQDAIEMALNHPLLDAIPVEQATGVIANFTGSDLTLFEVTNAMNLFHQRLSQKADVVWGVTADKRLRGRAQVILVLTGLGATTLEEALESAQGPAHTAEKRGGTIVSQKTENPSPVEDDPVELVEHGLGGAQLFSGIVSREPARPVRSWADAAKPTRAERTASPEPASEDTVPLSSRWSAGRDELDIPAFLRKGRYLQK